MGFPKNIFPNVQNQQHEDFWIEFFLLASFIWLCFLHSVSHKILLHLIVSIDTITIIEPSVNNYNSSHLVSVYCAAGLVLGDLPAFTYIFWIWIFYFTVVIMTFVAFFLQWDIFDVFLKVENYFSSDSMPVRLVINKCSAFSSWSYG